MAEGVSDSSTDSRISLKGSVEIIAEFFEYAMNSLLYLRGVYPEEDFRRVAKYGMQVLVTKDEQLQEYLRTVMNKVKYWLGQHVVQKIVLVIFDSVTDKVLERWEFDVDADRMVTSESASVEKSEKAIRGEIASIIRQMTTSVSYLPLLPDTCRIDLLIHTDKAIDTPSQWEESDAKYITNYDSVKLRSFTTKIHRIDTNVSYAVENDL